MATERYNNTSEKWVFYNADNDIVREANIGWGGPNLYFPAVSTCTALVTVLADNALLGAHFDKVLSVRDVDAMLDRMLQKKADRSVNHLAVIGNMSYGENAGTGFMSAPQFQGKQQLLTFAKKLGVTGVLSSHDQGQKANRHYRAQATGDGGVLLYYADVTYLNGNPVTFDRDKTSWLKQTVTPLRELY